LTRFVDLPDALAQESSLHEPRAQEGAATGGPASSSAWPAALGGGGSALYRVHFHVPLFCETLGPFASTQRYLARVLRIVRDRPICPHLEVEAYTWSVLPDEFRSEGIVTAVSRELRWVTEQMSIR